MICKAIYCNDLQYEFSVCDLRHMGRFEGRESGLHLGLGGPGRAWPTFGIVPQWLRPPIGAGCEASDPRGRGWSYCRIFVRLLLFCRVVQRVFPSSSVGRAGDC